MATYNRASIMCNGVSLLERAIRSFLDQDYEDAHLFIYDDHSTDNTAAILNKYKFRHNITVFMGDENKRPPNNWNTLWNLAGPCDLICQLHDDDQLTNDGISLRVKEFVKDPALQVVYGGVQTINIHGEDNGSFPGQEPNRERIWKDEYINFVTLMYRPNIPFRFEPSLRFYFDWMFKIRCLQECNVWYVKEPVMIYTVHQGQETNLCRRQNMNELEERIMRNKLSTIYNT